MAIFIVLLFVVSFSMFFYSMIRYKKFGMLTQEERKRYREIATKLQTERTNDEQEFYFQTQDSFYSLMISKYSFFAAILLIIIQAIYGKISQ